MLTRLRRGLSPFLLPFPLVFLLVFPQQRATAQQAESDQVQEVGELQVMTFMRENSDRVSLVLVHNGEVLADQQPNQVLPLASTVKFALALDVARMSAEGLLDLNEQVPLAQLALFHLPGTDGGAHPAWIQSLPQGSQTLTASLLEVARGMTMYSSNANTEYIIRRLGRNRLETLGERFGVNPHTMVYPLVGTMWIHKSLPGPVKDYPSQLRALSDVEYRNLAWAWSDSMAADVSGSLRERFRLVGLAAQRVLSDRLPASSAKAYAGLAGSVNRRENFSEAEQQTSAKLLEFMMESPGNQQNFRHAGMKGGSTGFLLTNCLYATDHDGQQIELVYFLRDLQPLEAAALRTGMNAFELAVVTDENTRKSLAALFKPDND